MTQFVRKRFKEYERVYLQDEWVSQQENQDVYTPEVFCDLIYINHKHILYTRLTRMFFNIRKKKT